MFQIWGAYIRGGLSGGPPNINIDNDQEKTIIVILF